MGLRLWSASTPVLSEWDEAYHALVARHLALHPLTPTLFEEPLRPVDAHDWTASQVWLHKPPLALWLMAASLRAFGAVPWALRFPSALLGTLSVLLTFLLMRRLYGNRIAVAAAAFQALNGALLRFSSGHLPTDHVDTQLLFWSELAMLLLVGALQEAKLRRALLGGVALGAALLTKGAPGLLPLGVLGAACLFGPEKVAPARRAGLLALAGAVAALVAAPWFIYTGARWPELAAFESGNAWRNFFLAVEGHTGGWLWHLERHGEIYGYLGLLPIIGLLVLAARRRDLLLPALWFALPLVVFTLARTKMVGYMLPAAPAVFLAEGWAALLAVDWIKKGGRARWAGALAGLLLVGSAGHKLIVDLPKVRAYSAAEEAVRVQLSALQNDRVALFNAAAPVRYAFYANAAAAYADAPSAQDLRLAREKGLHPVVLACPSEPRPLLPPEVQLICARP